MTSPLGLAPGTVVVVPYDARWPALFQAEVDRLVGVATLEQLRIEHTGSTSVAGLCAKPIIDLLAGHPAGTSPDAFIEGLVRAGYVYRGEQGIVGRHFFRRGDPRSYHVHLVQIGSLFWRDHLTFRDCLRGNAATRDAYAALKERLAQRHPHDRESYIDGKSQFVRDVLANPGGLPIQPE